MSENELSTLLEEVRNYLDITWDDPKGDEKLIGMIKRGMASLSGVLGELVMYERSGERQQFWINYKSEIISLQIAKKVDEYAEDQKQTV